MYPLVNTDRKILLVYTDGIVAGKQRIKKDKNYNDM
jgi:hypothetical protein